MTLDSHEVHVWTMRVCNGDPVQCRTDILDAGERARMDRFATAELQHLFLASHVLVRVMLSSFANVEPSDWEFRRNSYGAPRIARPAGFQRFRFNLSHTKGWAACAVSIERPVGVDLEHAPQFDGYIDIARRHFAASEVALLEASPPERRAHLFARLWTIKEAYIKACGKGISMPLDLPTTTTGPCGNGGDPSTAEWIFWTDQVDSACYQAVAARCDASESLLQTTRRFSFTELGIVERLPTTSVVRKSLFRKTGNSL